MSQTIIPGLCRYCACTEEKPCWYCKSTHGECCWYDKTRIVCSNPACSKQAVDARAAALRAAKPPTKYAGMGYGAIVADMRRGQRRKRRQKGRPA